MTPAMAITRERGERERERKKMGKRKERSEAASKVKNLTEQWQREQEEALALNDTREKSF